MAPGSHPGAWHAVVDYLRTRGPDTVFALPGDDLAVLRALDHSGVRAVLCRDQRSAVFMATGYAMQSGRAAVCVVGKGPAVTNTLTGLLEARCSGAPVALIAGGTGADRRGSGAFQEVDQLPLIAPLVKWSHRVDHPDRVAPAIARAFQIAQYGPPGPVYLEIPDHLIDVEVPQPRPWPDEPVLAGGDAGPAAAALLPRIRRARRPVLLLGGGLRHTPDSDAVAGFAARIDAAVFVTASGRGSVDEDHPNFCGLAGLYAPEPARRLWRETDLVIALGSRLEETALFPAGFAAADVPVIQVNVDPAGWSAEVGGVEVLGDAGAVVRQWLALTNPDAHPTAPPTAPPTAHPDAHSDAHSAAGGVGADRGGWRAAIAGCRRQVHEQARATLAQQAGSARIHVAEVLAALDVAAPPDRILVQENGLQDMWSYFYPYWSCPAGAGSVVPSEQTSLGFGTAAAAGVALAAPGRLVAALVGDGAFGIVHNELSSVADAGVGVLYVVLRNGGYGWLAHQWQPLATDDSRYRFVRPGAPLCVPRHDRVWHAVIDVKGDLGKVLAEAVDVVASGSPAVVEVAVHLDDVPPGIADLDGDFPGAAVAVPATDVPVPATDVPAAAVPAFGVAAGGSGSVPSEAATDAGTTSSRPDRDHTGGTGPWPQ